MRSLATYALLAGATTARMSLYQNPYDYFGTCMNSDLGEVNECREKGKEDAACCKFEVVQDSRNSVVGKFCVKDSQRFDNRKQELWAGTYRDHDYTLWKWECLKPEPVVEPEPETEEPEEKEEEKPEEKEEEKPAEEEEKPAEEEEKPKEEEEKPKDEDKPEEKEEEKPKDEEKPEEKEDDYYDDDEVIEETVYDDEELTFDEYQEKQEEVQKATQEEEEEEELWLPAWSSYKDKDMDLVLKITYWSGYGWIFGWILMLPLGTVLYSWMMVYSMWTFWEMLFGVGDFGTWFMGPVRRAWVGSFIYMLAIVNSTVPIWNILTSYYCGVWAYYDYFDYNYDDELGPLPPVKPEDAE